MSEKKPVRKNVSATGGQSSKSKPSNKVATKKANAPLSSKGADQVAERRAFFVGSLKWTKIRAIVSGVSAIALTALGFFFIATSKTTVYFQVNNDNQIVELVPLSEPRHPNAFVQDWLNKCMVKTFDFYYGNMDRHLSSIRSECYNDAGFESLMNGLRGTGNYDAIKSKELFSSFSFNATPTVVRTKSEAGSPYKWMIQGEGLLTLKTTTRTYPQKAKITAIVSRSSLLDDSIGLSIEKILLKTSQIGN